MWYAESRLVSYEITSLSCVFVQVQSDISVDWSCRGQRELREHMLINLFSGQYMEVFEGSTNVTFKSRASVEGHLPLGSDFPVEHINPLLGFYAAVSRLDVHGNSPHGAGGW